MPTAPPLAPPAPERSGRADCMTAARDVLARAAEVDHPGWQLTHGLYGWTAVRARDSRTEKSSSLPGLRALMSVAGR